MLSDVTPGALLLLLEPHPAMAAAAITAQAIPTALGLNLCALMTSSS